MNISDIRIKTLNDSGKLKAIASITIEDCFVVHDIKIIEGTNGLFIMMPGKKTGEGQHKDIAHPLNTETRNYIQNAIIKAYNDVCTSGQTND